MNKQPIRRTIALLAGALLIADVASAASKNWAPGGVDLNWSTVGNWLPSGSPATGDNVGFTVVGATAYVTNAPFVTNNVVDLAFTTKPATLAFNHTNSSHVTQITGPGLVVSSTTSATNFFFVGSGLDQGASPALDWTAFYGTSLAITNTNSVIYIGEGGIVAASQGLNRRATLNLVGLNNFSAKVKQLLIAYDDGTAPRRRQSGTLFSAKTNYITCTASASTYGPGMSDNNIGFIIAESVQAAGNACTNRMGQVNILNFNSMKIGGTKTASTALSFNSGWTSPTATFRNAAGTGRQNAWFIADDSTTGGSSGNSTAFVDFSLGSVDALVDTIYVGLGQAANNQYVAGGNGIVTFSAGTIDVNTLELGYQFAAGSSAGRGILNVNGTALLNVNKDIRLARNLGPTGTSPVTNSIGNLNINAGTVQVYGNIVDGGGTNILTITNNGTLNMKPAGDTIAGNIGVRVLNVGACTLTNYGTLNVSNLNVLKPASQFTVYPGQTLGVVGPNLVGTLTVNTNLILTNASLAMDLGTPGGANDQLAVLKDLSLLGTNSVIINPLSGFAAGAYPIVTYAGTLTGDVIHNLQPGGAMADSRYSLFFDTTTTANTITLNVSGGPAANLTWSGDGVGNAWNLHSTFNWNDGGGANNAKFYNLDTVTFDDTGSASPAVNLVGSLLPSSVTINGTKSYTLGGSGKISGSTSVSYSSTGTLLLLSTNDYNGTTTIYSGSGPVQVGNGTSADGGIGTGDILNNAELIFNSASFQSVPAAIHGTGAIVKRGPGVTLLGGNSDFSAGVTNEAGTLMLGNGNALGDTTYGTTINSGATLDFGGYSIGTEPVVASGSGVGGAGAIVNTGVTGGGMQALTLVGPTTFGGSSSWIIGAEPSVPGLQANTNKVTKVGTSLVEYSSGDSSAIADPGFGDIEIQSGTFDFYGYVGMGDGTKTITVRTNATLQFDCTGDSLTYKPIVMDAGSALYSSLPNRLMPQYATVPGPISIGGAVTVSSSPSDMLNLQGEVSGTGPLNKIGAGSLVFGVSNSFTGDLNITAGAVALTNNGSVSKAANIVLTATTLDVSLRTDSTLTLGTGQSLKGSGTIAGTLASPSTSTVTPGVSSIGAFSVTGGATLRGTTVMEMSKVASVYSADLLAVTGTLDLGGTLTLTYSGDKLQPGDTFQLFTAGTFSNAFTSVSLPVVSGVVWTNMTAIDGTVRVLTAPPPAPPAVSGGTILTNGDYQLNFSGPSGYSYTVWGTTNVALPLADWQELGSGTFSASPTSFTDLNTPIYPVRFYRVSIP